MLSAVIVTIVPCNPNEEKRSRDASSDAAREVRPEWTGLGKVQYLARLRPNSD
jgi:hypothetical protein